MPHFFYFYFIILIMPDRQKKVGPTRSAVEYITSGFDVSSVSSQTTSIIQESMGDQRFMRFTNPIFQYDFKVGNYMPDDIKKMNPHLFNTIKDITTGLRKSS